MSRRLFLSLVMLVALLAAPFGRMAAAEAAAMPHHGTSVAAAGHCKDMPMSGEAPGTAPSTIDCLTACATMAPASASVLGAMTIAAAAPQPLALDSFAGIHPEADPPPPRLS